MHKQVYRKFKNAKLNLVYDLNSIAKRIFAELIFFCDVAKQIHKGIEFTALVVINSLRCIRIRYSIGNNYFDFLNITPIILLEFLFENVDQQVSTYSLLSKHFHCVI